MDEEASRRRADDAPRGSIREALTTAPLAYRRALEWLSGARDDIDQQGLLAERTLVPRAAPEQIRAGGERPRSRRDEGP